MAEDRAGYTTGSPADAPASLDDARETKERRSRVRTALRAGERIPSADQRDREYQRITHRGVFAVLGSARRLTGDECQYIFVLLAHSDNQECEWATPDPYDTKPPTLVQWAAWLHMANRQQVNNIRASLRAKNIICYVDDDPAKVVLNEQWETWDQSVFTPRTSHGCKPTGLHDDCTPTGLPETDDCKPTDVHDVNPLVYTTSTSGFTRDSHAPRNDAARETPQKPSRNSRSLKQIDTSVSSVASPQRGADEPTMPKAKPSPRTQKAERPPRELTPDHQYRVDLLAALAVARGGKERKHDADWRAAGAFYALAEGTPPIERVVAWYRDEMPRPKWDTGYPDLCQLDVGSYRAYVRSAENYRQAIVRARLAADGKLGQQGDHHATTPRAYGSPAYAGRAASRSAAAQPDPHKDGRYAAFVD